MKEKYCDYCYSEITTEDYYTRHINDNYSSEYSSEYVFCCERCLEEFNKEVYGE